MFSKGESKECLEVTLIHALGLVLLYVVYAIISGNFQGLVRYMCPMPITDDKLPVAAVTAGPDLYTVAEDEEVAGRDSDHVVDILASMVVPLVTDMQCAEGAEGGGGGGRVAYSNSLTTSQGAYHEGRPAPTCRSMSLRRSMQLQRSMKYNPSGSLRNRSVRLAGIDWTGSTATFVADAPLFTWRSSVTHVDPLLVDEQDTQVLDGLVYMKTTPLLPAPSCIQHMHRLIASKCVLTELSTMAVHDEHVSSYLYCKVGGGMWELRYFTLDRYGFHSRKARSSLIRGPHITLVSMKDVTSTRYAEGSQNAFHILKKRSDGSEEVYMEVYAPTIDICTTIFPRIRVMVEKIKHVTSGNVEEQERINR